MYIKLDSILMASLILISNIHQTELYHRCRFDTLSFPPANSTRLVGRVVRYPKCFSTPPFFHLNLPLMCKLSMLHRLSPHPISQRQFHSPR